MSRMKFGRLEERVRMDQRAAFSSLLSPSLRHSFIKLITRPPLQSRRHRYLLHSSN